MMSNIKKFDLNIEKILENWEIYDAIREIIANAVDEQILTGTKNIEIFKGEKGEWHIRDFGRGLKYEHLTQNENEEKLSNPHVIGKFGIGLKDALATFDRNNVKVLIKSKYGDISMGKSQKYGFDDIITLHAYVASPVDSDFIGTEFILFGVNDDDIQKAKNLFLLFSNEKIIESTIYGDVIEKRDKGSKIYINGVEGAKEENFIFSYNITSLTKKIRQALNRERTNVGRSAYADRVKDILLACNSTEVANGLANELMEYSSGQIHDELRWLDVGKHAVKILNASHKAVFLTPTELVNAADMVDEVINNDYKLITIPENLKEHISGTKDIAGKPVRDLSQLYKEYKEDFQYKFVDVNELTVSEKEVFNKTNDIFKLIGGKPKVIRDIRISETMQKEAGAFTEAVGVWDDILRRIIIKRDKLQDIKEYAGILLHEVAHAISGMPDVNRSFEDELTEIIGIIAAKALGNNQLQI